MNLLLEKDNFCQIFINSMFFHHIYFVGKWNYWLFRPCASCYQLKLKILLFTATDRKKKRNQIRCCGDIWWYWFMNKWWRRNFNLTKIKQTINQSDWANIKFDTKQYSQGSHVNDCWLLILILNLHTFLIKLNYSWNFNIVPSETFSKSKSILR